MTPDKISPSGDGNPAVPWQKVMWKRQPFPDNYVDQRFLEELRRNEGTRQYCYWAVVKEAVLVGQQLSCVAIVIALWLYMEQGLLSAEVLLWSSLLSALLGYGLYQALRSQVESGCEPRKRLADLQSAGIFLSFIFGFSSILKTLIESVSTDTVYAMSAVMLLAHLVSFPYAQPSSPGSLSLNFALFASLCLASRLPSALHTIAMLTCALQVFALWPRLVQRIRENSPNHFAAVCVGVCIGGVGGLAFQWPGGAMLLALALGSITLLCPLLLIRLQRQQGRQGP